MKREKDGKREEGRERERERERKRKPEPREGRFRMGEGKHCPYAKYALTRKIVSRFTEGV